MLEKQYKQVRSADAKNLSGDSFCRQERRLFLEIQRY